MTTKDVQSLDQEIKKGRRRRRRAGGRAGKRRARKSSALTATLDPEVLSPVKCAVHVFMLKYQSAMRKIPAQLPPKIRAGPPSKRVKRVSWCEDNGVSACGGGDPAVLAMGPARQPLTYTRDELLRLRNSPLVKRNLENAFAGCEALALVLKRRCDSPNEDDRGAKGDAPNENHKGVYGRDRERRSADPRERVRKESEPSAGGIVLSPQRRSFTSGCGAPGANAAPTPQLARTRPDSPLAPPPPTATHQPHPAKTESQSARRIGSGRIMVAATAWEEGEYRSEPYRPPQPRDRDHARSNNDRFDRRSFTRDSYSSDIKRERDDRFVNEKLRDREDNRRSGGRFSQRRVEKEDEPEWFSAGPTSQLETIELRGFDEPSKKNDAANNKETDKWSNSGGSRSPAAERWRDTSSPIGPAGGDNTNANHSVDTTNLTDKDSGLDSKSEEMPQNNEHPEFNLDEFLKFDTIPDVLTNGVGEPEGGSRFSRWFRSESPTNDKHYERLLHNMVDDLDKSNVPEPSLGVHAGAGGGGGVGGGAHMFAPIAPAARQFPAQAPQATSLFDLLLRANANHEQRPEMNCATSGKMHSLEELEARLRPQHSNPGHHNVPDHDLTAFKRLLAQVSGGHAVPAATEPRIHHPPQPMSLLQMLNQSMEQQHKAQQQQQQQQAQQQQQQQPHIPQELLYKLLQVQQRQAAVVNSADASGVSLADRELLQRPEAQAIVHGLKTGEITAQHLIQQLNNPGLQSRHREVLLTILRLHQRQMESPLPGGVGSTHLVVPPHHQPLRLSPLPHQAYCVSPIMATSPNTLTVHPPGVPARIPSPRELAAHTQSIMQNALIKKKLEEQRENYRRRQEMQHSKQPTPISFTPTSVLRKMTAEKETDAPSPKQQQWTQPTKLPQGRPIVKGNQGGVGATVGYGSSPADYQQHYINQQQQMLSGIRSFPHPQHRQQIPNSYNNNVSSVPRALAGGSTLHKLLMQSHQRTLNELGGAGGAGGGDNQLARWFSPELLARASAGKLPSVHVPNALSLEDLERHHHPSAPVHN